MGVEKKRSLAYQIYDVFRDAVHEFYIHDGFNLAAGLSFFAILSLIPMALIVISILGHVLGGSEQVFEQIIYWINQTIPAVGESFILDLRQLVDKKITSGYIGIGFLIFVASLLFTNIEHILDKVLDTKKRNFWHSRLFSIVLLFFASLLFFIPAQMNFLMRFLPARSGIAEFSYLFQGNVAYFLSHVLIFVLLLKFVPNCLTPIKDIFAGAALFGFLTVLAREIFRLYMGAALERYHFVYGSLSMLVVLILWIYYLSVLFVFCAEVVSSLQRVFAGQTSSA